MRLTEILTPALIKTNLSSESKYEAFEELLSLLSSEGLIVDTEKAFESVKEREEKMATGITPKVGIPHGKVSEVSDTVLALGISKKGIEYDAIDGQPVKVIFLVLSETGNPGPHLKMLAEISRLVSDEQFVERLIGAKSSDEILKAISEQE